MRIQISNETLSGEFVREIETISGQNLLACNQCGKCSSGCPVADELDLLPSTVIRLAQLAIEDVLLSQTITFCASCQTCVSRCPKSVDLPRVMEALRVIAMRRGIRLVDVADASAPSLADMPQMAIIGAYRKYSV